jgi:hypothetical protein
MKSQVLANFHMPVLSCFGLILFVAVFVGALIWINRRGSQKFYESLSQLPLIDLKTLDSEVKL